jgi:hypothetical protein
MGSTHARPVICVPWRIQRDHIITAKPRRDPVYVVIGSDFDYANSKLLKDLDRALHRLIGLKAQAIAQSIGQRLSGLSWLGAKPL